jgi:hypothetical protein
MPAALKRLGMFLFCFGGLAVVAGLVPVAGAWVSPKQEQVQFAAAMVGGLMAVSGLVMDWLGSQAIREHQTPPPQQANPSAPPAMRLSASPKQGKGYREDLMA